MTASAISPVAVNPALKFTSLPAVEITPSSQLPKEWRGEHLVVPVYVSKPDEENPEDSPSAELGTSALEIDAELDGAVRDLADQDLKAGASITVHLGRGSPVRLLSVVGIDKDEVDYAGMGSTLAELATKNLKCSNMGVVMPTATVDPTKVDAFVQGMIGSMYSDNRYRTGTNIQKTPSLSAVHLLGCTDGSEDDVTEAVKRARGIMSGVSLCKDLVNAPANVVTPQSMAQTAEDIAKEHGMEVEILEQSEVEAMGMGAYMGVAMGSLDPPKFIHLTYRAKQDGPVKKKMAIVGKGLTFDSGGYNLKAGAGSMIEMMKFDMGGSGVTLGTAKAIGMLQPADLEVHFIIAACENMISDRAMRPGDILTASNGKTIEVKNTDAEGRLTLADALVFAENLEVDAIVDLATLTGACIVALGNGYAGLFSGDDDLAKALEASGEETKDLVWRMPMPASYDEQIKSKIADLQNIGGKGGGAITAALFLKHFVKKTPWAHIDIAGPVWDDAKGGATGFGVRLMTDWLLKSRQL
eukprot:CAMPEP_0185772728 /NCGR_PEP_ID=MMETSP1174-20130828/70446_1 /TAXON_ID=35687 /ORGANISM="Dictyocha speculum, Strain CCMP1381" /LENGTH=525 /DNA_ID=CAMNT_0028459133 /DNA_START=153 /DNA_END=1730 /DNA_ORIENTATION=+